MCINAVMCDRGNEDPKMQGLLLREHWVRCGRLSRRSSNYCGRNCPPNDLSYQCEGKLILQQPDSFLSSLKHLRICFNSITEPTFPREGNFQGLELAIASLLSFVIPYSNFAFGSISSSMAPLQSQSLMASSTQSASTSSRIKISLLDQFSATEVKQN